MAPIRRESIRRKLLVLVLVTTASALLISGASMLLFDLQGFRQSWVDDLTAQAEILGLAAAPALEFEDPRAAREYLASLRAKPGITGAAIYTAKGALFASYAATGASGQFPDFPELDGYRTNGNDLVLFKRIVANNEIIGTVFLQARYDLTARMAGYVGIFAIIMLLSLIAAALISNALQRSITRPILSITSVARNILDQREFSLRAPKTSNDEIGLLVDAFNDMLNEVGRRAEILEESNRKLEREVAERQEAEEARSISDRRHYTLITAMTQVVWTADKVGHFIEEQASWAKYTRQSPDDCKDLGWRKAFRQEDQNTLDLAWARAMQSPDTFDVDLQLWHGESKAYRYVSLRAVPLIDSDGEVREWIGTVRDVHDQRHAEQEIRALNAELEQRVAARTTQLEAANKELEAFSYSVSHDLRAPLRAIGGFSEMLWTDHQDQIDEEARRKLGIIRSEAERMGVLIDDLLAFSRLGRKGIDPVEVDMTALANSTFERLHKNKENGKLKFHIQKLPGTKGDRSLLEQVWTNLLSNAIKFSSKKDVPVVEVGSISEEQEIVYFVRDNGAGFDHRYKSKLFGVFQRLHDSSDFPGTGVGLALVSRIVTRHGGRVWADSQLGEGATFHFTLPKESGHDRPN